MEWRSYYNILNTSICLETPLQEVNDFCDYMWQNFMGNSVSTGKELIKVIPSPNKNNYYSIYNNGAIAVDRSRELIDVPYRVLSKALENVVNGHAINNIDKKDLITLHSGAVAKDNKAILILGDSGSGKSTFTLELVANHGWHYLTDEIGLLDENQVVYPFLKTVSHTPGLVKLNRKWISKQYGVDHQLTIPVEKHGKPASLKAIIYVKYSPDKEPKMEQIKKSDSLVRLFNSQIGRGKSVASVKQIAEVVTRVISYQIFHNDSTTVARMVTQMIDSAE